jgi:hypothetical protein
MRAIVSQANLSFNDINTYLQSSDEGERLLGISYVQWGGDERHFEQIVQIADDPKSAFEQYQVLRAIQKMLPHLSKTQKRHLQEVLIKQRDYNPGKNQWIKRGTDRDLLSNRILSIINQP